MNQQIYLMIHRHPEDHITAMMLKRMITTDFHYLGEFELSELKGVNWVANNEQNFIMKLKRKIELDVLNEDNKMKNNVRIEILEKINRYLEGVVIHG